MVNASHWQEDGGTKPALGEADLQMPKMKKKPSKLALLKLLKQIEAEAQPKPSHSEAEELCNSLISLSRIREYVEKAISMI